MKCSRCLFDDTTPNIYFDHGVCSYCKLNDRLEQEYPISQDKLEPILNNIRKQTGKYNVVVGISGGCDSSYLLLQAKRWGLRPLAVHFDNTWNTAIASKNMRRLLETLDIDLYTYTVDCNEYDNIYRAFIKAGTPDLEIPTDIGLAATLYNACVEHNIKYIFEGHSFRTEGVCPIGWTYMDSRYIQSVYDTHGPNIPLESFPHMWLHKQLYWTLYKGIRKIRPLPYLNYTRENAKIELQKYGWKDYGELHSENLMSYFYLQYYLREKFDVIPEFNQYSSMVRNGLISRQEAEYQLRNRQPYDKNIVKHVMSRLGVESIFDSPRRTHNEYDNYKKTFQLLRPLFWLMMKQNLVTKTFYEKYTSSSYS